MPVSYSHNYRAARPLYAHRFPRKTRRRLPWGAFFAGMAAAVLIKHGVAAAAFVVPAGAHPKPSEARGMVTASHRRLPAARAQTPRNRPSPTQSAAARARRGVARAGTTARIAVRRWDDDIHAHPKKGVFNRFYRMKVTAYTPINTRMEGGRWTYTSRDGRSAHGVAVDPDLIPIGTHLWIPGYGHAIADDIGGRIKGHRVDLRMQDAERMRRWGVRPVQVYVLAEPSDT